jgi:dienelactone hydrolase
MLQHAPKALLLASLLAFPMARADESAAAGQRIRAFLEAETRAIDARFLDGIGDTATWEIGREERRRQFLEMLGLWPLPERTPLNARVTGVLERDRFRVEKLHFQSRPGLYVTGNLYLPAEVEGKLPAVLYVCGHSHRGRDGNKAAFQHHGMWFATHGYACLIIDTLQLGEVPGVHHGTYNHGRWWWQARGYTPAGVECWNGIRALDYLQGRPEVDGERLAVTGISGGGMASFWIAAADERIKAAVPVSGLSDLETYVVDRVVNGHCDCMFLINAHRWPCAQIAALLAPRPFLFANSDRDTIFPMPGNHRLAAQLRALYGLLGRPQDFGEVVVPGGHDDKRLLRLAAYEWIHRSLKGDRSELNEPDFARFDGKELRVFPDELPHDAINNLIDHVFVPRAELPLPESPAELGRLRERVIERLRCLSFAPESAEPPVAGFPAAPEGGGPLWLLVRNPEGDDAAWAHSRLEGAIVPFAPRGSGENAWREEPPWPVRRSLALLGHTVDSGRVFDVIRAARELRASAGGGRAIGVAGRGQAGVIGAYAALLGAEVDEVVVADPPATHEEGPIFLNVLRVCDIPEALGLLAPRPLLLIGANHPSFRRTAIFYDAAGAREKLKRAAR